jgi:hypothetical protein
MSANYWVAGAAFLEANEPFAYTFIPGSLPASGIVRGISESEWHRRWKSGGARIS